jgi:hypothetical protein
MWKPVGALVNLNVGNPRTDADNSNSNTSTKTARNIFA